MSAIEFAQDPQRVASLQTVLAAAASQSQADRSRRVLQTVSTSAVQISSIADAIGGGLNIAVSISQAQATGAASAITQIQASATSGDLGQSLAAQPSLASVISGNVVVTAATVTAAVAPSVSPTGTPSVTPSLSPGATPSQTATVTPTASPTPTGTATSTASPTASPSSPLRLDGPLYKPVVKPALPAAANSEGVLEPCSDAVVDASDGLRSVDSSVSVPVVLALTEPVKIEYVGIRALTPSGRSLASEIASFWAAASLVQAGIIPSWADPTLFTLGNTLEAKLNVSAIRARAYASGSAMVFDAILAGNTSIRGSTIPLTSDAAIAKATPSYASTPRDLLLASGNALYNATGNMLAWARRVPYASHLGPLPRELLLRAAAIGASVEIVASARNAAGLTTQGGVALTVGSVPNVEMTVQPGSGERAILTSHLQAVTIAGRVTIAQCGGAAGTGSPRISGVLQWSLRVAASTPINSSWPLAPVDLAVLDQRVQSTSGTANPARRTIVGGILPAGRATIVEMRASAILAGSGIAVNGAVNFTITVPPTAGISVGMASSAGTDIGAGVATNITARISDLDGLGAGNAASSNAASLNWACTLVPGESASDIAAVAAAAASASGGGSSSTAEILINIIAAKGSSVPCSSTEALNAAAIAGNVSPVDMSASPLSTGARVTISGGALRAGALLLRVTATSGQTGALPPNSLRQSSAALLLQVRPGPALAVSLSATGSATGVDGVRAVIVPQHQTLPIQLRITAPEGSTAAGITTKWRLRRAGASSTSVVSPSLEAACMLAAGRTVWSSVPRTLRAAAGETDGALSTWQPFKATDFLTRARQAASSASLSASTELQLQISAGVSSLVVPALPQGWGLSSPSSESSGTATPTSTTTAADLTSRSASDSRSLVPCSLQQGVTYEVLVETLRASDGAAGSSLLRITVPVAPSQGSIDVASVPGTVEPTGPNASSFAAAVVAMQPATIVLDAPGWVGATGYSYIGFLPAASQANAIAASPTSMTVLMDAIMTAPRLPLGSAEPQASSISAALALPLGSGESRVLVIAAVVRSASGAVTLAVRRPGSPAAAMIVQSRSPLPPVIELDFSDDALAQDDANGTVTVQDVSAVVDIAASIVRNSTASGSGFVDEALSLGDVGSAVSSVAGLAGLLAEAGDSQARSVGFCLRELLLGGSDSLSGPHTSCSGFGACEVSGPSSCRDSLAFGLNAVESAPAANRSQTVSAELASLESAGCGSVCLCQSTRGGAACGLDEAASEAQTEAKALLIDGLTKAAAATDTSDDDAVAAAASAVRLVVSGDPTSIDANTGDAAAGLIESLAAGAVSSANEDVSSGDGGSDGGDEQQQDEDEEVIVVRTLPVGIASELCGAASGLIGSGNSRASSAEAGTGGGSSADPNRRRLQSTQSAADLQSAADAAWNGAQLAFRARALLAPAAQMGFVSQGGSYGDSRLSVEGTSRDGAGVGASGQAASLLQASAADGGGGLITVNWGSSSPYSSAAAAARLQLAADNARSSNSTSTSSSSSSASDGVSAVLGADASIAGSVVELSVILPSSGRAAARIASGAVGDIPLDAACLARGGSSGSLAASYGLNVTATSSGRASALDTGNTALGLTQPHIRCLTQPLQIQVPLPAGTSARDYVPRWWSSEAGIWTTAGTIVLSVDEEANIVTVATTHLTGFAATKEDVLAQVILPNELQNGGILLNYLNPENLVPILVIGSIVIIFFVGWVVAWRYDAQDRQVARLMAARRALLLSYGYTNVPAHERARTEGKVSIIQAAEEEQIFLKMQRRRARKQWRRNKVLPQGSLSDESAPSAAGDGTLVRVTDSREAPAVGTSSRGSMGSPASKDGDADATPTHGSGLREDSFGQRTSGLLSKTTSKRRVSVLQAQAEQSAKKEMASTRSSALAQYARYICAVFLVKLRSDHPLSFCTAPPAALVAFTRTQRVAVLCVMWLLSMSVAAIFYGAEASNIEVRIGIIIISALCTLPATFMLPFLFKQIAHISSSVKTGEQAPSLKAWFASVDQARAGKARHETSKRVTPASATSSTAALTGGTAVVSRSKPAAAGALTDRPAAAVALADRPASDSVAVTGLTPAVTGPPVIVTDGTSIVTGDPGGVSTVVSDGVIDDDFVIGGHDNLGLSDAEAHSQVANAMMVVDDTDREAEDQENDLHEQSTAPDDDDDDDDDDDATGATSRPRLSASATAPASVGAHAESAALKDAAEARDPSVVEAASADGDKDKDHDDLTAEEAVSASHASGNPVLRVALGDSLVRPGDTAAAGAGVAEWADPTVSRSKSGLQLQVGDDVTASDMLLAAEATHDTLLLTSRYADVILQFSPFYRGPPGGCATILDVAAYFTLWCGLAMLGVSAVFGVSAEGLATKSANAGLTPMALAILGVCISFMGAIAVYLARKASARAKDAASHGHRVFLAQAAAAERPISPRASPRASLRSSPRAAGPGVSRHRSTVLGAFDSASDGVVLVSDLEIAATKGAAAAKEMAHAYGCLGGEWMLASWLVLAATYLGQAAAAVLLIVVLDAPLSFEACIIVAALEGVLILSVMLITLFLRWDSRRALARASAAHKAKRELARRLHADTERAIERSREKALRRHHGMPSSVKYAISNAIRKPDELLDFVDTAAILQHAISGLHRFSGRDAAPKGVSKAMQLFQRAAATVLAREVISRKAHGVVAEAGEEVSAAEAMRLTVQQAVLEHQVQAAVLVQSIWRGHASRRAALRMYELRIWEEDLWLERSMLLGVVYTAIVLLLVGAIFLCLVFGVVFAPEQARAWLFTSLSSFALDLLVQKPIIIFLNAVALTVYGACTGRTAAWTDVSPNFVSASGSWLGML